MGFASKAFEVRRDGRGTTSPEVAVRGRRACEGIADNHAIGHALANARISIVQPRAPHALGASEPNFPRSSYLDQAERDRNVVRRGVGIGTDLMRLLDQRFRLGPGEAGRRNVEGDFETKAALRARPEPNSGHHLSILRNRGPALRGQEPHRAEKASCVAGGQELLGIIPITLASKFCWSGELYFELAVDRPRTTVTGRRPQ
jgi:hypothetical protein